MSFSEERPADEIMRFSDAAMAGRVAHFSDLSPLPIQASAGIPEEALDVIYARKLLPVIGRDDGAATAITSAAPIKGADGITVTIAVCPAGQGPSLHLHRRTYETFTVLRGSFEIQWGDRPHQRVEVGEFDTVSVPPGVYRAFRNIGAKEGIIQVIVSGNADDMNDVHMPEEVTNRLRALSPELIDKTRAGGLTFQDAD